MLQQIVRRHSLCTLPRLESIILSEGNKYYGEHAHVQSTDDIKAFEFLTNDLQANLNTIRSLITDYHFIPIESVTPTAPTRLSHLLQTDITFLDILINPSRLGLPLSVINTTQITHLLSSPSTHHLLPTFLARGFTLTRPLILHQLRNHPTPEFLEMLQNHVADPLLRSCTRQILQEYFGPSSSGFQSDIVTNIVETYVIGDSEIAQLLFLPPTLTALPYSSRCYEQTDPVAVWKWVVDRYGPHHAFSVKCFDDLVLWVSELGGRWRRAFRNVPHRNSATAADMGKEDGTAQEGSTMPPSPPPKSPQNVILTFQSLGLRLRPRHIPSLTRIHAECPVVPALALSRVLYRVRTAGMSERERKEWEGVIREVAYGDLPVGSKTEGMGRKARRRKSWSLNAPPKPSSNSSAPITGSPYQDAARTLLALLCDEPKEKSWKFGFGGVKMGLPADRAKTWDVGGEGRKWGWMRKGL